ncbi:hypothetical protein ACQY0O_007401 [Thecaphora frezii]
MTPSTSSSSSHPSTSTLTGSKLDPFLLLARSTKPRGAAAAKLIQQVTDAQGVYAFSELLELPEIAELQESSEYSYYYRLLELFAYGTYADYASSPSAFPELSAAQRLKLRQLTLVTLASRTRVLRYEALSGALDMDLHDMRSLEDLIIESIYAGLVAGKLNQTMARFEVDHVIGRDVRPSGEVEELLAELQRWSRSAEGVLQGLQARIDRIRTQEAQGAAARQEHNQALYLALQQAQESTKGQRTPWNAAEGMDLESWDEAPAAGRVGLRKKNGSGGHSSTQRAKRSRA